MPKAWNLWRRPIPRLFREPLVHFFLLGALLFGVQRLLTGNPRVILVTPGLEAELARQFQDAQGRTPDAAELAAKLHEWEHDEALFREALRRHLDRDDPSVRSVLVDKMRALAAFEVPQRSPSEAELQSWLTAQRSRYETPLRYDFEFVKFPKAEGNAAADLERFEQALRAGASPSSLQRPILGANLALADMQGRIAPELAARIPLLALGQWQRVETEQDLLLVQVKHIAGGLPDLDTLRPLLIADWSLATRQADTERVLQRTLARYRIEKRP